MNLKKNNNNDISDAASTLASMTSGNDPDARGNAAVSEMQPETILNMMKGKQIVLENEEAEVLSDVASMLASMASGQDTGSVESASVTQMETIPESDNVQDVESQEDQSKERSSLVASEEVLDSSSSSTGMQDLHADEMIDMDLSQDGGEDKKPSTAVISLVLPADCIGVIASFLSTTDRRNFANACANDKEVVQKANVHPFNCIRMMEKGIVDDGSVEAGNVFLTNGPREEHEGVCIA